MHKIPTSELRRVCHGLGWNEVDHYENKDVVLFAKQRWYSTKRGLRILLSCLSKKRERGGRERVRNDTDFCTMEAIPPQRVFSLPDGKGWEYHFDFVSLIRYFLSTGSFVNPYTLNEIKTKDIERLQKTYLNKVHNLDGGDRVFYSTNLREGSEDKEMRLFTGSPSLLQLRARIANFNRENRDRETIIAELLSVCDSLHQTILSVIAECSFYNDRESLHCTKVLVQAKINQMAEAIRQLQQISPTNTRAFIQTSSSQCLNAPPATSILQKSFRSFYINSLYFMLRMNTEPTEYEP